LNNELPEDFPQIILAISNFIIEQIENTKYPVDTKFQLLIGVISDILSKTCGTNPHYVEGVRIALNFLSMELSRIPAEIEQQRQQAQVQKQNQKPIRKPIKKQIQEPGTLTCPKCGQITKKIPSAQSIMKSGSMVIGMGFKCQHCNHTWGHE